MCTQKKYLVKLGGSGEGKDISLILHWVLLSPVYFIFKCTFFYCSFISSANLCVKADDWFITQNRFPHYFAMLILDW